MSRAALSQTSALTCVEFPRQTRLCSTTHPEQWLSEAAPIQTPSCSHVWSPWSWFEVLQIEPHPRLGYERFLILALCLVLPLTCESATRFFSQLPCETSMSRA